jgi:FkbM family methyltransferase
MEKKLRAFLLRILGVERYLSLVSGVYIRLIRRGLMKKKYPELFYLKEVIKPGFTCIDIGANVGYYSVFLSLYAGTKGHIHAVEPVALFAKIFKKNTLRFAYNNITLHETALGGEDKMIQMGTPVVDGVFRHGLTKVVSEEDTANLHTYEVKMQIPDELFRMLTCFDFLKCDVEGYEVFIMPYFIQTIRKFRPLIQMEIGTAENRKNIIDLLTPLGYAVFKLHNDRLQELTMEEALQYEGGDFYLKVS